MLHHYDTGHDDGLPPVLLIHGAGEDADLLSPQAHAIAETGRRVIWYDRRGTGRSTRDDWPGKGADQHADDAAQLLRQVGVSRCLVLGFSSGGIVALALAARHRDLVEEAVAWEAPVVTVLPDGVALQDQLMAATEAHVRRHPGDWLGAYWVLAGALSGGEADRGSPALSRMSQNAEPFVADDGRLIVKRAFVQGEIPDDRVTIAIGEQADPLHVAISENLSALIGCPLVRIGGADQHEIYVADPDILAAWLRSRSHPEGRRLGRLRDSPPSPRPGPPDHAPNRRPTG